VLLNSHPVYLKHVMQLTGLNRQQVIAWFTFLLALHDIGKFADSFQNLNTSVSKILARPVSGRNYSERHDSLGWLIWNKHLRQRFAELGLIETSGSKRRQSIEQPVDIWMAAMVGHHGQPPKPVLQHSPESYLDTTTDFAASTEFAMALIPLFLGQEVTFPECEIRKIQLASWWLSGLAVLSDWLGSNTRYFPYRSEGIPLTDYWEQAKEQAKLAVQDAELLSSTPSRVMDLGDLVRVDSGIVPQPTPLQHRVTAWEIADSPHLFILEDVTGAGKTEAAVLLAHSLMRADQGNSLYFALPTMATANTMYSRMSDVYRRLFTTDSSPSLVLAHGARDMSLPFRQSVVPEITEMARGYGDGTLAAGAHCSAWLADNRKKALLADVGIGTIDQALLGILPARHQSLRLLGLLNKILIVDEVHACDAYMHELLCSLLRAHAASGGSAILLSATLPKKQRQALLNAYAEGQGWQKAVVQATDDKSYPLMSGLNAKGLQEAVVATRESVRREVNVEFLSERDSVESLLGDTIANGQCACWIRNTVKDAIDAYQDIKQKHPGWDIDLFHARYALADRIEIETRVVRRFDKDSTAEYRKGQILIATQVVEQSLDLDFDTLITDLAPIDLIIQRAGRLRRHSRDQAGNQITGVDQRGDVVLHVLAPEMTASSTLNWYADFFPYAQKVYPHHGQLWLTAELLHRQGKFRMPEDARMLIENVYDDEAQEDIPEALLNQSIQAEGGNKANASIAHLNALKMEVGYSDASTNRWWDEAKTPTRLGEETTTVYLARYQGGVLSPWSDDQKYAWPMSAVSMRTYWIAGEKVTAKISQELIDKCKETLPAQGKWGVLLPLEERAPRNWYGMAMNERQESVQFFYNEKFGLITGTEPTTEGTMHEFD
jgi:CRISPR-associated endonuclease/helicase Cas3